MDKSIKKILLEKGIYLPLSHATEQSKFTSFERLSINKHLKVNDTTDDSETILFYKAFNIKEKVYQRLTKESSETEPGIETKNHFFSYRSINDKPILFAVESKEDPDSCVAVNVNDLDFIFKEEDFL